MSRATVIAATLNKLQEQDYRSGFNDSVLSYCRDALNEFDGSGREFWSIMCCGYKDKAFENFFNSDPDLVELYKDTEKMASGPGCFVMPSWGTRGT